MEFDANDTSLLLLTSWSHAILFHRASPNLIYLSSIIPNDPHDLDLRIGSRPNSAYSVGVRPDWRLFKLVYASLLGADQPEVKSRCWSRGSALDLTEVLRKIAKEKDKGKKRKRDEGVEPAEGRSGGDFEGEAGVDDRGAADVAEAMADPQVSFEWGLED